MKLMWSFLYTGIRAGSVQSGEEEWRSYQCVLIPEGRLQRKQPHQNCGKHFFTGWVTEHRLPRELVEPPSLEIFKSYQDMVMGNLFWMSLLEQRTFRKLGMWPPENSSHLNQFRLGITGAYRKAREGLPVYWCHKFLVFHRDNSSTEKFC